MMSSDHPFWDFSLQLYAQPGVAEASLALQDRFDMRRLADGIERRNVKSEISQQHREFRRDTRADRPNGCRRGGPP